MFLGKMRTLRSVSLGNRNSCSDAFEQAFVTCYFLQRKEGKTAVSTKASLLPHKIFFLLVNSTDPWYKKRAPKELPSEENQDSCNVFGSC